MTLAAVTVTGTLLDAAQSPQAGTVTFTPVTGAEDAGGVPVITSIADATDLVVIPMSGVTETLDATGRFSTTLTPTDASGLAPAGWMYQVAVQIAGVVPDYVFTCAIPSSPSTVDLSALVPVTPPVPSLPGDGGTAEWNLAVTAGSLATQVIGLTNPDGSPWDIAGDTWEYTVRTTASGTGMPLLTVTTTANADGVLDVTATASQSQVLLTLYPAATAGLNPGTLFHALWANPGSPSAVAVAAGELTISAVAQP